MKNKSRLHTVWGVRSGLLCRVDCMALNLSPRLFFIFFYPSWRMRATSLPRMSNSRLTVVPGRMVWKLVLSKV